MKTVKADVSDMGFQGILYPVNEQKDKVVITLSGSEGGIQHAKKMACFHNSQGMSALAIAYFGTKKTKQALSKVPIEYIENAIKWLMQQGYKRIAIEGISKGAEYALAAATIFQEISSVILKTPTWYYGEGLIRKAPSNTSCWTYQGEELPYTPYKERVFDIKRNILQTREYNILSINTEKKVVEPSIIQIEKVNGPVLIFSTKADTVWPSAESGEKLNSRLRQSNFPYPHKHICFTYMSHIMLENANSFVRLLFKSEKEHPKECAEERKLMGQEVKDWLQNVW